MPELEQTEPEPLMTAVELRAYLRVGPNGIARLIREFGLPHYRLGGRDFRFRREEIDTWLLTRRVP